MSIYNSIIILVIYMMISL